MAKYKRILKTKTGRLFNDDCFNVLPLIANNSVDMILCDLPYGTTQNKWDSVLLLNKLWQEYWRVIKSNGAIVLTTMQPFTTSIIHSNLKQFKYNWVWIKENGTGFLNAKKQPLRVNEDVLVFYSIQPTYNPIMRQGFKSYKQNSGRQSDNYGNQISVFTQSNGERYPITLLEFARDKLKIHPTQKPVALFEYLIKTYTNESDLVLDNCSGSGTTAIAAINTNRRWVCIEKDEAYARASKQRIKAHIDAKD